MALQTKRDAESSFYCLRRKPKTVNRKVCRILSASRVKKVANVSKSCCNFLIAVMFNKHSKSTKWLLKAKKR